MWSGDVFSCANIVRRLWFDYSDNHVDIGLPIYATKIESRAYATRCAPGRTTVTQMREAERALNAEYQRFWRFLDRSLKPVDTNPLPASKRQIRGDLDTARMAEELIAPSALAQTGDEPDRRSQRGGPQRPILPRKRWTTRRDTQRLDWGCGHRRTRHDRRPWRGNRRCTRPPEFGQSTGSRLRPHPTHQIRLRDWAHIRRGIVASWAPRSPAIATSMAINDPSPASIPGLFDALDGLNANLRPPLKGNRTTVRRRRHGIHKQANTSGRSARTGLRTGHEVACPMGKRVRPEQGLRQKGRQRQSPTQANRPARFCSMAHVSAQAPHAPP